MTTTRPLTATQARGRILSCERGFTLIEALIAVLILIVGLVAVSQLLVVAASSNSTANGTSAAAAAASRELERLQTVPFANLAIGGSVDPITPPMGPPCTANYFSERQITGVGTVRTCWQIQAATGVNNLLFITVRSQVLGPFTTLTRAEFSTFRAPNG